MKSNAPRISICLPVYNGENYVREAIRSVLDQTFKDFELIISDNSSVDRTAEICREFASKDPRVHYSRSEVNRGLAWNYNHTFEFARGSYVMWMSHDDILAKDYVGRCFEALEQDLGAGLCFTNSNDIDEKGNLTGKFDSQNVGAFDSVSERYKNMLRFESRCDAIFGLMRRDVLKQTRMHGRFDGSDWVLLTEMGLRGRFILIPDFLFSRRKHVSQASRRHRFERTLIFDPTKAGTMVFPFFQLATGYLLAISRAQLPWTERLRCYEHFLKWLWPYRTYLLNDLIRNLDSAMQRHLPEGLFNRLISVKRRLFKRSWT
jgi:glycosyltransferase involved in cell wall biosynthesis